MPLSGIYDVDSAALDQLLRVKDSFDVINRKVTIGDKRASFYMIDGFVKDEIMEKIMEFVMKPAPEDLANLKDAEAFSQKYIPYVEVDLQGDDQKLATAVLSGTIALVIDGYAQAILIDARTYPTRGVEEPEDDRVLRGSRDGFVETIVFNTALIRRRIRDVNLTMEITKAGRNSKTDIVLCYIKGKADEALLKTIRQKLDAIDVEALSMGQESLMEALVPQKWFNPFPKVRYTERPDAASASILEGKIILLVDNSPAAIIFPTAIFDFVQESDDYYFPPFTGTYLRLTRIITFILTLFLTPIWYLLIRNPGIVPPWLDFITIKEPNTVPVLAQLLIIEFAIDSLKLASLNTPSMLSSSFSVVGALILGDFAVRARWFVPEVILYMAFVAIANFTQPSYELGYAFKFMRIMILILTGLFNYWGFAAGVLLMLAILCLNKTVSGKSYLYPLIPFNRQAFQNVFFRHKIRRNSH